MSAHYDFSVSLDVRADDAEAVALMTRIGRIVPYEYELLSGPSATRDGCVTVSISGEGSFRAGDVLAFDKLVKKLGERAVAPTTARYTYEHDSPGFYYVGPAAMRAAYVSGRALEKIRKMVDRLTPEDVATLRDELAARPTV